MGKNLILFIFSLFCDNYSGKTQKMDFILEINTLIKNKEI